MATVIQQKITDQYAVYNGDCCQVLPNLPNESIHFCIYSPPFADLYNYSSDDRDMSNCKSYKEFIEHYRYLVVDIERLLLPGRLVAVHCMDLKKGSGNRDFPGDIIRLHEKNGFIYHCRHCIWKDPLLVAMRTRVLGLAHKQIVKDSTLCRIGLPDYVLVFRKKGKNPIPVQHPLGLSEYAGERSVPQRLQKYIGWKNPRTNKLSHWIWQQYASPFWDDIRLSRTLPYREAKEKDDEKHVCPLQLDCIHRCLTLWTNKGETVLTPFMGVGSEVYEAVKMGRKGIGIELKKSYWRQSIRNIDSMLNSKIEGNSVSKPIIV